MNEKTLSVIIPCYNSQAYMERAICSALTGGPEVEILIIDDGSTDETGSIAENYQEKYPERCLAIHQENSGYGGAVITGIQRASGWYTDILDSDDWLDEQHFGAFVTLLSELRRSENSPDIVIRNMDYEKAGEKYECEYRRYYPLNRVFEWNECRDLPPGTVVLIHASVYKTECLRKAQLNLPKHTFYVDHLYAYLPLVWVRKLYYTDKTIYHYLIGRPGQSVQEDIMMSRLDHVLKVAELMMERVDLGSITQPEQRRYMRTYLEMVLSSTYAFLTRSADPESRDKRDQMIACMERTNPWFSREICSRLSGKVLHMPEFLKSRIIDLLYRYYQRRYHFN